VTGRSLLIRVFGVPASAGSKTPVMTARGPRVLDGGSKAAREHRKTWRSDVVDAARTAIGQQYQWQPFAGPVHLDLSLFVPRPKSTPRQRRDGTVPKPITRPDATKLLRSTEDALTVAGVWGDDSQVTRLTVTKTYADADHLPGALIFISEDT
jgi:Holliday junction resolvase RusA-like endonuclease